VICLYDSYVRVWVIYFKLFFERFDAPSLYLAPAPMLAAFAAGRSTALVVDCGGGGCSVTPVLDGFVLRQPAKRTPRGGEWITDQVVNFGRFFMLSEVVVSYGFSCTVGIPLLPFTVLSSSFLSLRLYSGASARRSTVRPQRCPSLRSSYRAPFCEGQQTTSSCGHSY